MTTSTFAFLNDSRLYVLPSTPGRLKSGAAEPMGNVFGSPAANADEIKRVKNMKSSFFIFDRKFGDNYWPVKYTRMALCFISNKVNIRDRKAGQEENAKSNLRNSILRSTSGLPDFRTFLNYLNFLIPPENG